MQMGNQDPTPGAQKFEWFDNTFFKISLHERTDRRTAIFEKNTAKAARNSIVTFKYHGLSLISAIGKIA